MGYSSSICCKSLAKEEENTQMVNYGIEPGLGTSDVWVELPLGKADRKKEHALMLPQEIKYIKFSAAAMSAKLTGHIMVAIVDTGSDGVAI